MSWLMEFLNNFWNQEMWIQQPYSLFQDWAILPHLYFHMDFRTSFSVSAKERKLSWEKLCWVCRLIREYFLNGQIFSPRIWDLFLCTSVQSSSVAQSCMTLCDPMNHSTPGLPVHHQLLEFTQTHVHRVSDAIQPSHPLSSPSPPDPNPSQHQSLFQWVNSSHEVAKVLEFQLQHQSFQWIFRTHFF